jgi:hypothetical protein
MTFRRICSGTRSEGWLFDEHDPENRCLWPTADAAYLACEDASPAAKSILGAYIHLLTHPAGTEEAIKRLRALRGAERTLEEPC